MTLSIKERESTHLTDWLVTRGEILHQVPTEQLVQQTRRLPRSAPAEDECGGPEVFDDFNFLTGDVKGEVGAVLIMEYAIEDRTGESVEFP